MVENFPKLVEFRWDLCFESLEYVAVGDVTGWLCKPLNTFLVDLSAKTSLSKFSASSLVKYEGRWDDRGSVACSGKKGTSMLESTSCSKRPNIWISCILARAINLSFRKGRSFCLSQNVVDSQNGSHQNVFLLLGSTPVSSHQRGSCIRGSESVPEAIGSTPWKLKIGLWWSGCLVRRTRFKTTP